jgi:hypothetical protein
MENVAISKRALISLIGGLVAALVAIAFLLGRESAHPPTPPLVLERPLEPVRAPTFAPAPRASAEAAPRGPSESAEVAAYFQRIKEIQVGESAGSEKEYAGRLLTAAVSGDSSGFANLASSINEAERRARAITPPSPCAAYHETMLGLLGESKTMVAKMKDALDRKDADSLSAVASAAGSLQSRTEALEAEEQRLRRTYAVP